MRLSVKGLAWTGAVMWGACVLLTGIVNLVFPKYGVAVLEMARSIYPGYGATAGLAGVIVGTLYAVVDGAVCGAILAWLYNRFAGTRSAPAA